MRVLKASFTRDVVDTAFVEIIGIDAIQSFDIGIATLLEAGPVVAGHFKREAIVGSVRKPVRMIGGVPHDFFRDTTDIYAGATERPRLYDGCLRSILGRTLCVSQPTAATADYQKIIFFGHSFSCLLSC